MPTTIERTPQSKYTWRIYIAGNLFVDLTGLVDNRHFVLTRNDSDYIECDINLDTLEQLCTKIGINSQDVLQTGVAEIRVARYGVVLTAGLLFYWETDLADPRKITMKFKGWFELLKYRISNNQWNNVSQLQIVQNEINATQALSYGNFGFTFGAVPSPDNTNTYGVKTYQKKSLYDIFQELSAEQGGFDFQFTWDKKINIFMPGQGTVRQDIVFSYPGNVQNIKLSSDFTKIVNELTGRGSGSGGALNDVVIDLTGSQQEFGLFQGVVDFPDIDDQTQLNNLTQEEGNYLSFPVVLQEITLDGGREPQVGSYNIGDQVRLSVLNILKLYSGLNNFFKINVIDVTIDQDEVEKVKVSTQSPSAPKQ